MNTDADKYEEAAALCLAEGNYAEAATSLNDAGFAWSRLGENRKAVGCYERALPLRRAAGDQSGEAVTLNNLGLAWADMGDSRTAIGYYEQALPLFRAAGDRHGEAITLSNIGGIWSASGAHRRALEFYEHALLLKRQVGDRGGIGTTLNNIGRSLAGLGERQQALEVYAEALSLIQAEGDRQGEATTLNNIGKVLSDLGETRDALEYYEQALLIIRAIGNRRSEAWTLNLIGGTWSRLGEKRKALGFYEQALPLYRAVSDPNGEAMTLSNLGTVLAAFGEKRKALEYFDQALLMARALGNRHGEANTLNNIGIVWADLGEKRKALEYYEPARLLFRQTEDPKGEALALHNIGAIWSALGEKRKAIEYYEEALPLTRKAGDRFGEAATLNNLGIIWSELGEKQKALTNYEQVLEITRAVGDKIGESKTLGNIGFIWADLGEHGKALECYGQALTLVRSLDDKSSEAATLANIARTWVALGEFETAREFHEQAQHLYRVLEDRNGVALTLHGIAHIRSSLGEKREALELYGQSLSLRRLLGDRKGEAETLNNIGHVWADLRDYRQARECFEQALPLWRAVGDRRGEATTLNNLMHIAKLQWQPDLAIHWGKQSVIRLQALRAEIQTLEIAAQQSFQREVGFVYAGLAELLLSRKRLAEAHQLLNLAKDQEFYDQVRSVRQPAMSRQERGAQRLLESAYRRITSAGRRFIELQAQIGDRAPSAKDVARLQRLRARWEAENAGFQAVLRQIADQFKSAPDPASRFSLPEDLAEMQDTLRELHRRTGTKAVALYTLMGLEHCHTLLIAPDRVRSAKAKAGYSTLHEKALRLLGLLQNPDSKPRRLAREMYDLLFQPIEREINRINPSLLMWSMDRSLRYLPMGALFDGRQYLVERYQHVVFTRADKARLLKEVSPQWTGVGFASSGSHIVHDGDQQLGFRALPGVLDEMDRIFGAASDQVWRDERFTKPAMFDALKRRRPLVHIASHFHFHPGDDHRSFLLLGNGETLSLAEMKEQTNLFAGVELLNLSACNTAAQLPGDFGREVDGFAELAQRLGAGAVMATLWEVWDESTSDLMADFYGMRQRGAGMTKAAALQQAQIALLRGAGDDGAAPRARSTPKAPYAHPYYWAPFALIGNWR